MSCVGKWYSTILYFQPPNVREVETQHPAEADVYMRVQYG